MSQVKTYAPDDVTLTCTTCEWFGSESETEREDLKDTIYEIMHCPCCGGVSFLASHLLS